MAQQNILRTPENTDPSGFVLVSDVIPDAILDIRYYSTFNFLGQRVDGYEEPVALLTRPAALALKEVSDEAITLGYRLKIFDCYRPQCAVDHFVRWAEQHQELAMQHYFYPEVDKTRLFELGFVAKRSGHSRGSTVDLTLFDMATQTDIDVGGTFDYFGNLSWSGNTEAITPRQAENRALLRDLMQRHGFYPLAEEWWHFTLSDEPYPDTYFTFPVNSNQVRQAPDLAQRLAGDMEFRLRFYDVIAQSNSRTRALIAEAVQKAFALTAGELQAFARRENVALNTAELEQSIQRLNQAVNAAVKDILQAGPGEKKQ